ncbi:MAG: beta-lactamase family protein [Ruminococcaceae bacterium]|nr:beta-lactamase family protein [Oscillospiraceae bacterium]
MDFTLLRHCLDDILKTGNTPSVDCIVYQDHQPLFRYFAGQSDIENNVPIKEDTLYLIFSMTKMLTVTAALQLLERGKYTLEDELATYIPAFRKMKITRDALNTQNAARITTGESMGESVTVREDGYAKNPIRIIDLFTMQGGLDYDMFDENIQAALADGRRSTVQLVEAMAGKTLGFEPGTRFRYSLCHDVLGALVEIWSGERLGDYMQKHIFEPLGMNDTAFGVPKDEAARARLAARYSYENGVPVRQGEECVYNISPEYQSGGAGLCSCTEDYALFLDALACGGVGKSGNRILKEETVRLMGTNQLSGQSLDDFHELRVGYGYGLGVRTHMEPEVSGSLSPVGEFGWDGAAGGFSMVDTENKLSLTYFQHSHSWSVEMQGKMRNALYACLKAKGR